MDSSVGSPTSNRPVLLDLSRPPVVVSQGKVVHGVESLVDEFQLPQLWSLHLYAYSAELFVDGVGYRVTPGNVSLVPPGSAIRYRYRGASPHLYAHLRVPADPRSEAEQATALAASPLSLMMSPGPELPMITDLLESAVASAVRRSERTQADIWMVLLRLADRSRTASAGADAVAAQDYAVAAMSYIESRLANPITIPQVAKAVGISHNHLTRVFTAQTGQTVVGYLRRRRIDHAKHLLTSTTMSISAIAATVGISDLQAFNKTCRAITGQSPRQLRGL